MAKSRKNSKIDVRFSNGVKRVTIIDCNYRFQDNIGNTFLGYVTRAAANGYDVVTCSGGHPVLLNPLEVALLEEA